MSLSMIGEVPAAIAGAFAGVAVMGAADHYSRDGTLLPFPLGASWRRAGGLSTFVPLLGPLLTYRRTEGRAGSSSLPACFVQIVMAVLWAVLARRYGMGWPLISALTLTLFLGAIAVIDFQHRVIPSLLVYPTIVIALAGSPLWPGLGLLSSLEGAAAGFALFFALALFARFTFGEGALGDGDVTLAAAIGAICGFPLVVLSLAMGAFLGGLGAILVMIARRSVGGAPIPYGPFLIGGVLYVLLSGNTLHPMYSVL